MVEWGFEPKRFIKCILGLFQFTWEFEGHSQYQWLPSCVFSKLLSWYIWWTTFLMDFVLMFPDPVFSSFCEILDHSFIPLIHPASHVTWFTSQLLHMIHVLDYSPEGGDHISKTFGFLIVQSCKIHFFSPTNFEQLVLLPRLSCWTTCITCFSSQQKEQFFD